MNSFFNYMGGKSKLAPFIVSLFPKHECYCEIFGGAGWVLFHKSPNISKTEVYNDIDSEIVNLFVQIKNHLIEVQQKCFWLPASRELYKKYITLKPENLSDIEKAVRFLYCIKNSFSGQLVSGFSGGPTKSPSWHGDFVKSLKNVKTRLDGVLIENLNFKECIEKYDEPTTLFYLDPPYFVADKTRYYRHVFDKSMHQELKNLCLGMKGKFILSYEDTPYVNQFYAAFNIIKTPLVSVVSSNKEEKDKVTEILIMNFEPTKIKQLELL